VKNLKLVVCAALLVTALFETTHAKTGTISATKAGTISATRIGTNTATGSGTARIGTISATRTGTISASRFGDDRFLLIELLLAALRTW
jgi:hypothetical protein